jgi:hypothetical protein
MGNREMYGKDEPKEGKGPADKELIGCVQGDENDPDILAEQIDQAYEKEKYKRALGDGWKEYDIPALNETSRQSKHEKLIDAADRWRDEQKERIGVTGGVIIGGATGTFNSDGKNGTGE